MTNVGKNMRITMEESSRSMAHALFGELFGCSMVSPMPGLEVFRFPDGFSLGVYYVAKGEGLGPADHRRAPWLELCVDDPEAAHKKLAELGIEPFDYFDKTHRYYCPPCGPVFRIAKK